MGVIRVSVAEVEDVQRRGGLKKELGERVERMGEEKRGQNEMVGGRFWWAGITCKLVSS